MIARPNGYNYVISMSLAIMEIDILDLGQGSEMLLQNGSCIGVFQILFSNYFLSHVANLYCLRPARLRLLNLKDEVRYIIMWEETLRWSLK